MAARLIKIYEDNPDEKHINEVVKVLRQGGLIIYPTDTVYGLGCDITNSKALERIARIKGVKLSKANFSFICSDLSLLSDYVKPINNSVFKILKRALPGAFTFILQGGNHLPKDFKYKKTVGIRVPNNSIARMLVDRLGNPIVSTSVKDDDDILEYTTEPELIFEKWKHIVDIVIDGGVGGNVASTVVDLSKGEIEVLREGKADIDLLF